MLLQLLHLKLLPLSRGPRHLPACPSADVSAPLRHGPARPRGAPGTQLRRRAAQDQERQGRGRHHRAPGVSSRETTPQTQNSASRQSQRGRPCRSTRLPMAPAGQGARGRKQTAAAPAQPHQARAGAALHVSSRGPYRLLLPRWLFSCPAGLRAPGSPRTTPKPCAGPAPLLSTR